MLEEIENIIDLLNKLLTISLVLKGRIIADNLFYNNNSTAKEENNLLNYTQNIKLRQKPNGSFEARCRKNGNEKSFSGKTKTEAIRRANEYLITNSKQTTGSAPKTFRELAEDYMKLVKTPDVVSSTLTRHYQKLNKHIYPVIGDKKPSDVSNRDIQEIYSNLKTEGKFRTLEDVNGLLHQIFDYAKSNRFISENPMDGIKVKKHYRTNGQALTLEDEKTFVENLKRSDFRFQLLLLLYSGMRPCELETARFEDGFIICENKKRKNRQKEYKKIPITPMLAPYMDELMKIKLENTRTQLLYNKARPYLAPKYTLKDLRHTFITRCQMCNVPENVVKVWAGHAPDARNATYSVYTHFDDRYLKDVGKRVRYDYNIPNPREIPVFFEN